MTVMKNELENLKEKCESTAQALKDRDETIKNNNMGMCIIVKYISYNFYYRLF